MTDMRVSPIPELDSRGLRQFAFVFGGIVAVLFGLLLPWLFERSLPVWPWLVLAALGFLALARPMSLRPVYRLWMRFGWIMGRITTPIIMGILFFVVISPIALIRALLRKDSMARKFDPALRSYRVRSKEPSIDNLKRPF